MTRINARLLSIFLFSGLTALTISCKKSDDTAARTNPAAFTYKVDGGSAITVDSANAVLYSSPVGRMIDVYAFKGGNEVVEFHFAPTTGNKTAGTTFGSGAFLTYMPTPIQSFDSQSGAMNVTTCDTVGNKLEGDFNFVGKEYPYTGTTTHTITEGHMVVTKLTRQ